MHRVNQFNLLKCKQFLTRIWVELVSFVRLAVYGLLTAGITILLVRITVDSSTFDRPFTRIHKESKRLEKYGATLFESMTFLMFMMTVIMVNSLENKMERFLLTIMMGVFGWFTILTSLMVKFVIDKIT